jgi:phospholipid/cholesterol/gamma-HCH transport system permease protein
VSEPAQPQPAPPPEASRARSALVTLWGALGIAFEPFTKFVAAVGDHVTLLGQAIWWLFRPPFRLRLFLDAMEYHGIGSLPIISMVGTFTGMVTALQSVNAFRLLQAESFAGSAVGLSLAVELAPVLTALMLAGRVGAGIATELGTMRITEQIDALESMAVNPHQYLILPRIVGSMLVTPILTLLFFVIGMGGAYLVAIPIEHVDQGQWIANVRDIVEVKDVVQGFLKAILFGLMVSLVGCYQGYNASGGGRGVGMGTTRAVVIASVATLVLDYFLSDILLTLMPPTRLS